jgi:putative protein-disulfide isomerase
MARQLIYFADPMCSWCWGFSPAIESVRARFADELPVKLILGGLRPGTAEPMDEAAKSTIREHWDHVREASGQPFDYAFFERQGFVYDTEPACRAAVAARRLDEAQAMPFLAILHKAFYAENRNVTDRDVLCGLAAGAGLDRAGFEREFDSPESLAETRNDFMISRQAGVTGFPTLLAGDETEGFGVLTRGYQSGDKIETLLAAWLERTRKTA